MRSGGARLPPRGRGHGAGAGCEGSGPRRGVRLTGVLVLQRAEFLDLVCTLCTTLLRSRQLYLDSPIWSKLST